MKRGRQGQERSEEWEEEIVNYNLLPRQHIRM